MVGSLAASAAGLKPLSNLNNQFHESSAAADRITEMLEMPQEPLGKLGIKDKQRLGKHHESVLFKDVVFKYNKQNEPAVRYVSLSVKHGMEVM